jgi:hypothetical protein
VSDAAARSDYGVADPDNLRRTAASEDEA